ncbi:MAG: hypothetical protein ABSE51_17385 [Terracidiphilus sp.]|jgi:hypothetical protein
MKNPFSTLLWKFDGFRFRRSIKNALALNLRNEVRPDGLALSKVFSRLEIEWYARDIHPWDRDRNISQEDRALMFEQQCLRDTEAAISRLFERLPQVDTIELRVLEFQSKLPIITATVTRSSLETSETLSVGMRLLLSGAKLFLSDWQYATLELSSNQTRGDAVNRLPEAQAVGRL